MHLTLKKIWASHDPGYTPFPKILKIISGLILKHVRQIWSV